MTSISSFQPISTTSTMMRSQSPSLSLSALSSSNNERVKKAGGGIPVVPSGNCLLFDPEEEGKLQGTGSLSSRIHDGSNFILPHDATILSAKDTSTPPPGVPLHDAQQWLEHLSTDLPLNFAKPNKPVQATVLARSRIIADDAPGDIQHVILRLPQGMHYVEGQSLSVIPPGIDPKNDKKYSPRLYSIASTRYGDALDGNTISLCVRRAEYYDPITGQVDPSKKGICSNYLCDATPGMQVNVAGPVGKTMLLPSNPNHDVIMIATGTGIAPFRGFMHRLFMEETVARHMFGGTAWLVLGVPTSGGLLYKPEFDAMLQNANPGQLKIDYAISREMKNTIDGGKLYVQNVIAQNGDEFFNRLDNGASAYFCGLKGMMPPILDTLEKVALEKGIDWNSKLKYWKSNHQWHVEVY
jgi:ferredoxin--NADP+ reductase